MTETQLLESCFVQLVDEFASQCSEPLREDDVVRFVAWVSASEEVVDDCLEAMDLSPEDLETAVNYIHSPLFGYFTSIAWTGELLRRRFLTSEVKASEIATSVRLRLSNGMDVSWRSTHEATEGENVANSLGVFLSYLFKITSQSLLETPDEELLLGNALLTRRPEDSTSQARGGFNVSVIRGFGEDEGRILE